VQTLVWNKEDAQDIVNETAIIAFEKFEKCQDESIFIYFLFGIANKLTKRYYRYKSITGLFVADGIEEASGSLVTDEEMLRHELNKALRKLTTKQRICIVQFEINGFSIDEIAKMYNYKPDTVKSYLRRGREKLRQLLSEHDSKKSITTERSEYATR
jgi:RNA polymerase sigma-70 factor (ECF subfamily)